MTYKKLSLLLLLALLATSTLAQFAQDENQNQDQDLAPPLGQDQDENPEDQGPNVDEKYPSDWTDDQDEEKASQPWECKHDHQDQEELVEENVDEPDYNPEGNDHEGRTLQSYSKMRTYGYYGNMRGSASFNSYVQNKLVPPILDYFAGALRVKYPISGLLRVTSGSVCGISTPAALRNGVAADFALVVLVDSSSSYVASSSSCSFASQTGRPIVGRTTISQHYMQATTNVLLHERNMICIMHEVIHALGWTNGMYSRWLDYKTGRKMSAPTVNVALDGANAIVLQAEPLRTMVREYFGCPTIRGAYFENLGQSGTYGCHFERRQFAYEAMTSGLIYQMQFSKFTLGLLESTGWYAPDYSFAEPFNYGQGEGCGFLTTACSRANTQFEDLCSSSSRGCTSVGRGGGVCGSDSRSNNCRFQQPQINYDCESSSAQSYARLPQIQTFGRGSGSKCFTGSLASGSAQSKTSFCFRYSCSGSGSGAQLTLQVGSRSVLCTSKGAKTVPGYAGTIDCPDPVAYCRTFGAKTCPRNCMGRGTCVNGACVCRVGRGTDCAAP